MSETAAAIVPKIGVHAGAVSGLMMISPGRTSSSCVWSITTRAMPSATPGDAGIPRSCSMDDGESPATHPAIRSGVIPNSMRLIGSWISAGGVPVAGGAGHVRSASRITFRSPTSRFQRVVPPTGAPVAQVATSS